MKKMLFIILAFVLVLGFASGLMANNPCSKKVMAYVAGWGHPNNYDLNFLDMNAISHAMDAFALPNADGSLNMNSTNLINYPAVNFVTTLHNKNVRVILSLGGADGGTNAANFAANSTSIAVANAMALKVYNVVAAYNYDGVDLDWEFPTAATKNNYTNMMTALYNRFHPLNSPWDGKPYEVTFYTTTGYYGNHFNWAALAGVCDYAIQSGYDWCTASSDGYHNAPLYNPGYTSGMEGGGSTEASINGFAQWVIGQGFPANKFILGLPTYAFPTTNAYPCDNNLRRNWAQAVGTGTYNATYAESKINISGTDYWFTNVQGYQDKIAYVKAQGRPGIAIWESTQMGTKTDIWTAIRAKICEGETVPTNTPTPTADASVSMWIDNFEDGDTFKNQRLGTWGYGGGAFKTTFTAGAYAGNYSARFSGDLTWSAVAQWPSLYLSTELEQLGNTIDVSTTTGLRFYSKLNKCTGAQANNVAFWIQLVTPEITDFSYWRYLYVSTTMTATNTPWTELTIPWTSFTAPPWGQGATMNINQLKSKVKAIQWAVVGWNALSAGSCTGNYWDVDDIRLYGGIPFPTYTFTPVATITDTPTPLPPTSTITETITMTSTKTATPTITRTATKTNTATATPSSSPPPTNTVTGTVTQTRTPLPTNTATETVTGTRTPLPTNTATETVTKTNTRTSTMTSTPTNTRTSTMTVTPSGTDTPDYSPTVTRTVGGPSDTVTPTITKTNTPVPTATITRTDTKTATETSTAINTATITNTVANPPTTTITPTITDTVPNPPTLTSTPTNTKTSTAINTATITQTDVAVSTATNTQTELPANSPTETSTVTATVDPLLIDDAEDADMASNQQSGAWTTYASPGGSSVLLAAMPGGANSTGNAILFKGDVSGAGWPSISVATDLQSSGLAKDVSIYQGMTFWQKGTGCVGTSTSYIVMLVTDNITDSSYWRTTVTIPAAWTQVNLNWSSFAAPNWGGSQGESLTLADILPNVKAIQWVAADTSGGTAACTNLNWYIDEVQFIPVAVGTATTTPTITPTPIPGMIDNMEDNDMAKNMLDGSWTTWSAAGSTVALSVVAGGANGTNFTARMTGDVAGTSWPSISIATDLDPSGMGIDIQTKGDGISFWHRGTGCTGTSVQYLVMPVSMDITDSSHWRAQVTIPAGWTQVNIPWSAFNPPSWGQGAAMSLAQAIASVRSIQFVATDGVGGTAACTGLDWYIDELKYIVVLPTATTTPTVTTTQISSATFTPTSTLTSTPVNTNTITQTATITETLDPLFTLTFTPTITQTHTVTKTVTPTTTAVNTMTITPTQTSTIDVNAATSTPTPITHDIVWPNPGDPEKDDITIRLTQVLSNTNCSIKIYTASYRLVDSIPLKNITGDKLLIKKVDWHSNLAQGVYYIVAEPEKGDRKIIKFIVMKKGK